MTSFPPELHLAGITHAVQARSKSGLQTLVGTLTGGCGHPHNFAVAQSDLRVFVSELGAECLAKTGARAVPLPLKGE